MRATALDEAVAGLLFDTVGQADMIVACIAGRADLEAALSLREKIEWREVEVGRIPRMPPVMSPRSKRGSVRQTRPRAPLPPRRGTGKVRKPQSV